jgi:hypothetical protein
MDVMTYRPQRKIFGVTHMITHDPFNLFGIRDDGIVLEQT